jgi:hypothetical protein
MKKKSVYAIIPLVYMSLVSFSVQASPSLSTFYNEVITRKSNGKLGQIIKQERISTPIGGAEAWRIAYISSDVEENKTISTALIVAPKGKPPLGGATCYCLGARYNRDSRELWPISSDKSSAIIKSIFFCGWRFLD